MFPSVFNNSYFRQHVLTKLTEKSPGNVAPILPIEAAVTGGRSYWGWQRTGWLEFQERLFEELITAGVWLYGVKAFGKLMDMAIRKLQENGKLRGLYTNADWSKDFMKLFGKGQKSPSILLSPIERFSHNHDALQQTMKVKGWKLLISVAVPLFLCGYVIPRLNQLKTEWLIKHFDKKGNKPAPQNKFKQNATHLPPQQSLQPVKGPFSTTAVKTNGGTTGVPKANLAGYNGYTGYTGGYASYNYPPYNPYYYYPGYSPTFGTALSFAVEQTGQRQPKNARFGFLSAPILAGVSKMGHFINNTPYGEALAVDTGVTGGRMLTAWPRSKFESFEYGARDAGSLVFYMLSVPWMMNWASKKLLTTSWGKNLGQSAFGQEITPYIMLDEQATNRINSYLTHQVGNQPISKQEFQLLLNGNNTAAYNKIAEALSGKVCQVSHNSFMGSLKQELLAYTSDNSLTQRLLEKTEAFLKNHTNHVSTDSLEQLLKEIWNDKGAFGRVKALTDAEKFHLSTAAKLSFHHHAGLTLEQLKQTALSSVQSAISDVERQALLSRLESAAQLGGNKVIASAMRRSLSAAQATNTLSDELVQKVEAIVRATERAVIEGTPIESFAKSHLSSVLDEYKCAGAANSNNVKLAESIKTVRKALDANTPLSRKTLEQLADLLEVNGRTLPKALRLLQGQGLHHLAANVRLIAPLMDGQTSLEQVLVHQIEKSMADLTAATSKCPHPFNLIKEHQGLIGRLLKGEGRVALLLTKDSSSQLQTQLNGIIRGGLKNNEQLYNRVLRSVNRMPMDAESFFDPSEFTNIKTHVDSYLKRVETRLAKVAGGKEISVKGVLEPLTQFNMRWRYGAWGTAVAISMLGVGVLIPKLQYWMTLSLTGKDIHPGLLAVSNKLGGKPLSNY